MTEQLTEQTVWEGVEALRPFLIRIDDLEDMEENPREHDVAMISESLRKFGQVIPIVVRTNGTSLVSGHGRKKAARALGWTHLAGIPADFDADEAARLFALIDNISHDAGRTQYEHIQMDMFSEAAAAGLVEFEEFTRARAEAIKESDFTDFSGDYAEDPEGAAARAAALANAARMKEIVLMMPLDDYELFGSRLRILMPVYGTSGVGATLMHALELEALRVGQAS